MELLEVLDDNVTSHPLVFLGSPLMAEANPVFTYRERHLLRNTDALIPADCHIGNLINNHANLEQVGRNLKILVTVCQRESGHQQQKR
jgi:hypothetical protein